ncbi:hypothetical protein EC991_010183 [Linnemannia zychae]|nr:hypothetical protein EC991_010183 [Linnemannia zychae]
MSSLTLPSAVAKVQDVVNAIIDGRYHDLDTWTATSAPIKQRIRAFSDEYHLQQTTGVGQEQQQHDLQLLTRALLATWSQTAVGGGKFGAESNIFPCYQEQDKVEEEKHILQWFEVTRNKKSNSLSSSSHYNHLTTTPSMDYYDTSLVFQRTLDYSGTEMKTSRVQALVPLTTGQQGAVQLRFYPGVLLVSEGEEEEESTWKFHGVVCLPAGSEKNLISEGWSCMQGGAAIAPQPTAIGYTGIGIQGIQEQQLQCKAPAIKHRVEEDDDDSDDDYWGQYGEADSNHEEGKSSGSGSGVDATACSLSESGVSYPSSSSASSDMALSSSTYHHPSSVAVETSTTTAAATTVFGNAFSRDFSSGSHPNNCRWDGVNEEDDDSDDEYWGKYGDCDEDESEPEEKQRHPQGQELLDEQGQGSEVYPVTTTMSKDSSHASKAERQKIDPLLFSIRLFRHYSHRSLYMHLYKCWSLDKLTRQHYPSVS